MDLGLKGKKVLVFGASAGIGSAIAEAFVQEGAKVLVSSRTESSLKANCERIGAFSWITSDLTKPHEAKRATLQAIEKLGGLDVLVTNTGGPKKGSFLEVSEEQWALDFQSLWMSVVESLNVALPVMRSQQFGRVLGVTSLAAREPLNNLTTSNGLRAGLAGLFKSIANEQAAFNITLNLLLPGYTNTDRLKQLALTQEQVSQMLPTKRLVEPRELADLACFLASPRTQSITGQSWVVDGGSLRSH